MSSNERIGTALNSSNLKTDDTHFDSEIIASLSFASKLGIMLQHMKSGNYITDYVKTSKELSKVLKKSCVRKKLGISYSVSLIVSQQALKEWLINICKFCNGTGHKIPMYSNEEFKSGECKYCAGTGIFKPVWKWRKSQMKLVSGDSDWWDKRISLGKEICDDAYRSAQAKVKIQTTELFEN